MLKRSTFITSFLGMLGMAKAQAQWKHCTATTPGTTGYVNTENTCFPPKVREVALNNQCPVCGEMAEPFRPKPDRFCGDAVVSIPGKDGLVSAGTFISACDKSLLPKVNLVRCKRCNAAFWQDAEVEGK